MAKPSLHASQTGTHTAKQALTKAGWTQKDLSALIGCSRQPITNFFKGDAIAQSLFIQICDRLGLNWQEIAGLPMDPAEPPTAKLDQGDQTWNSSKPEVAHSDFLSRKGVTDQGKRYANVEPHIDVGEAPNLRVFYGRTAELDQLKQWILQDQCQLIALLGIRGIGKTSLAAKLIEESKGEFDSIFWRSLNRNPPPLRNLLADVITFLSNQQSIHLPEATDERISMLIEYLRQHRCLLILDNAELLMQAHSLAGYYQAGCEEYGELLRRVGTERHQSCFILTSRDNPKEVAELEARDLSVHSLTISGLPEIDADQLLASKELLDQEHWGLLIEIFQGNPLALQIVSATIRRSFGGKVSHFLKQETITTRQVVDLLDQQFTGLSALEREIIYWLAVQPQPISFADLKETIKISGAELLDALESLLRRSLIQGEAVFTLDPLVQHYVANEFNQEELSLDLPQARDNIRHLLERCFDQT